MSWNKDLSGQKFKRLLVLKQLYRNNNYKYVWLCRCDCGKEVSVDGGSLVNGDTKSCGCLFKEIMTKHQKCLTKEYRVWADMKQRCTNPKSTNFKYYGAKGITVCDEWLNSFESFLSYMGKKPTPTHSIDRINFTGNYEPGNCRWATREVQDANTSRNRMLEYDGKMFHLSEWARRFTITNQSLRGYLLTHTFEQAYAHYIMKKKMMLVQYKIEIKEV